MRSNGWGPNPVGLVSLLEEIRPRKEDDMRTQREDGHLQAKEREGTTSLRRNQPCRNLELGLQPPELWEIHFYRLSPSEGATMQWPPSPMFTDTELRPCKQSFRKDWKVTAKRQRECQDRNQEPTDPRLDPAWPLSQAHHDSGSVSSF